MLVYKQSKILYGLNIYKNSTILKRLFLTANFPELTEFPSSINSYESLHKFSIENADLFWGTLARSRLEWSHPFSKVTSGSFNDKDFNLKWFIDGKLNVSGTIVLIIFRMLNFFYQD